MSERWTASRKEHLVGLWHARQFRLVGQIMVENDISVAEFARWVMRFDEFGIEGLLMKNIQRVLH